ncbi:FMN-binding negative transcriptional regulator [Mucilaginibacter myungsuensis]|uniref:FMN-binding negative transcriptional regulator n=1 Tax=Mucilaginibacter myungsuensis TaxID=649104 RepID=A0A929L750_9SPHI|nr:FMN-binding negative transcriptional regulator [Mucilaginibacter myungsuensis]MBE9664411.1 FMN-binding negative transcriptional regulator [Mucilaginibacter myungsuensis]MDN3597122.1 FMN-binding negative transcriptional regulator [Mucilaginibacter myungsuensis]
MYIPKHFRSEDKAEAIAFMRRYSFATLVTAKDNYPEATNLPFTIDERDGNIILSSHFAKANPQAQHIADAKPLVVFGEPHAYISPSNYERELNVPTWNYIAVHAYGNATIVANIDAQLFSLGQMITSYDQAYLQQWGGLPMDYKLKMINGIVAFEIKVTDLQAKYKLSQNRSEVERDNIIDNLNTSKGTAEQDIARYMTDLKGHQ